MVSCAGRVSRLTFSARDFQGWRNPVCQDRNVGDCRQPFARDVIDDVEDADAPAVGGYINFNSLRTSSTNIGFGLLLPKPGSPPVSIRILRTAPGPFFKLHVVSPSTQALVACRSSAQDQSRGFERVLVTAAVTPKAEIRLRRTKRRGGPEADIQRSCIRLTALA